MEHDVWKNAHFHPTESTKAIGVDVFLGGWFPKKHTPPKINMEPENDGF